MKKNGKKILITGATGFLGSHIATACLDAGFNVCAFRRKKSDLWRVGHIADQITWYDVDLSLKTPFKREGRFDCLIHAATVYGRGNESASDVIRANLAFPLELLENAVGHHTGTFLNIDTTLDPGLNGYALSKSQFTEWFRRFSDDVVCVNLKIDHLYGPGDDAKKFIMWLLVRLFGENPEIPLTSGNQTRDFLYVSDAVNAILLILNIFQNGSDFKEFDIGTGISKSVKSFVLKTKDLVEKTTGKPVRSVLNFGARPYRKGEIMQVKQDISEIRALGWEPKTDLDEGIEKTIRWFVSRSGADKSGPD